MRADDLQPEIPEMYCSCNSTARRLISSARSSWPSRREEKRELQV